MGKTQALESDKPGLQTRALPSISCVALGNLPTLFLHLPYGDNTSLAGHAPRVIRNHTWRSHKEIKHRASHVVETIFPAQGSNASPGVKCVSVRLPHWQAGSSPLAPPGKPVTNDSNDY